MKRITILQVLWFACALVAWAQGSVKGKVLDKQTNEALQYVNIRVAEAVSGKLVKGGITDAAGSFHINGLSYGQYKLQVTFVGYKTVERKFAVSAEKKQAHFSMVYLSEDQQTLKEVQVTGQRSQM